MSSSMEKQQDWTVGPAAVNSENVQSGQGNLYWSSNQKILHKGQLSDAFRRRVTREVSGYVFAIFIFHLDVLHGFKVLTPGQGGEVSLPPGSATNVHSVTQMCNMQPPGCSGEAKLALR